MDSQYLAICRRALEQGFIKENRTGWNTIGYHGDMMKFDMADGFPAITTKKLAFYSCISEMLAFLRGYDNAGLFREMGTKVWDENANGAGKPGHPNAWLSNPNRKGTDDLGRVYGVQARSWTHHEPVYDAEGMLVEVKTKEVDQFKNVLTDLAAGKDNRREIVLHWNPGELDKMALPPCHLLYQFGLRGDTLDLTMYQRSCDLPLGVPYNIAGYSWLLHVVARITGKKPGVFTWMGHDIHIYEHQIELMRDVQLTREPYPLPTLWINPEIKTLEDLETWVTAKDFRLEGYQHHDAIPYAFAT